MLDFSAQSRVSEVFDSCECLVPAGLLRLATYKYLAINYVNVLMDTLFTVFVSLIII